MRPHWRRRRRSSPREVDFLAHFQVLARQFPRELARAALETAILRREAVDKFPQAARMYFTRPALEQATTFAVSAYRAQRFSGFDRLIDLGCSIGGDTQALARQAPTLGVDLDPLRLAIGRANLAALGLAAQASFVQADLTAPLPWAPAAGETVGLFFDPARRQAGRRLRSLHDYLPPLETAAGWLAVPGPGGQDFARGADGRTARAAGPALVSF